MPSPSPIQNLTDLLSKVTDEPCSDNKTLLKAYATFSAMSKSGASICVDLYKKVLVDNSIIEDSLLKIFEFSDGYDLKNASEAFLKYSPEEFLRFITVGLVADVSAFISLCDSENISDILLVCHIILQINSLKPGGVKYKKLLSSSSEIEAGVGESSLRAAQDKLYKLYRSLEKNRPLVLSRSRFFAFFRCINLHILGTDHLKTKISGTTQAQFDELIDILYNKLELSREQQIELVYHFYYEKKQQIFFTEEEQAAELFRFIRVKDTPKRKRLYKDALKLLASINSPLAALQAITVRRRAPRRNSNNFSDQIYSPNDIPLENTVIYSAFTSLIGASADRSGSATILFPSVFFIKKWLEDDCLRDFNVRFVIKNKALCDALKYNYSDSTFGRTVKENVSFMHIDDWLDNLKRRHVPFANVKFLAFFYRTNSDMQKTILESMLQNSVRLTLFIAAGTDEFSDSLRGNLASVADDPRFAIRSVELLPQNILGSDFPKKKLLAEAEISDIPVKKTDVALYADSLNVDQGVQAVACGYDSPIYTDHQRLISNTAGIRRLFISAKAAESGTGGTKEPAYSYDFTPDIRIWYSRSYPKNNLDRPRLEAYFCRIAPEGKVERGYTDRGLLIEDTRKRTTKVPDDDAAIREWISKVYPFETVRRRGLGSDEPDENILISVREIAVDYYVKLLREQNIALKTLWYLHPNLSDVLPAKDYEELNLMMLFTSLGNLRVQDITGNAVEGALEEAFPGDTDDRLYKKFKILSTVMDSAVRLGYCEENPLAEIIRDNHKRDKLFSQVRNALVKKHFTEKELRSVFELADQRYRHGHYEYLGILLRLLTGLSSNVICGLKWKDLQPIDEYGIYKLVITRQAVNDGTASKGFASLEDYLCFPCSDMVRKYLENAYLRVKNNNPEKEDLSEHPIVWGSPDRDGRERKDVYFSPAKLQNNCKKLIKELGLPSHIITVPGNDGDSKETDLAAYGGDFLRENFRFWCMTYAGMTGDETAYLMGNTPETTFGRYYCDFLNDASQYLLYVKLRRLDTAFYDSSGAGNSRKSVSGGSITESFTTGTEPSSLQLWLKPPRDADHIDIELDCSQSMTVTVSEVKGRKKK